LQYVFVFTCGIIRCETACIHKKIAGCYGLVIAEANHSLSASSLVHTYNSFGWQLFYK
jgi:hypothetical protein